MANQLSHEERRILTRLVFAEGPTKFGHVDKKARTRLRQRGYIAFEPRPDHKTAQLVVLTDRGWAWVADNLGSDLAAPGTSVSRAYALASRILSRLKSAINQRGIPLGEFLGLAAIAESSDLGAEQIPQRVWRAYRDAGGGNANVRVDLSALRDRMADVPRERLDAALLELQRGNKLVLMQKDDPLSITEADESAAIRVAGHLRHIIYMKEAP